MENNKRKPYTLKVIIAGVLAVVVCYLMTFVLTVDFQTFIMYAAAGLTILAVVLSGTAVSGDRMRANNYSTTNKKNQFKYMNIVFLFAIPFYLLFLIMEFLI